MQRRNFLKTSALAAMTPVVAGKPESSELKPKIKNHRQYWIEVMMKIATPVLKALDEGRLMRDMPVETKPGHEEERKKVAHLEAVGRLYSGMAPWIELPADNSKEGQLSKETATRMRAGLSRIVNPDSPDFLNFTGKWGRQPLVDAATLAHALIKAPKRLIAELDSSTKKNLVYALENTREITPPNNNWLLFSAMIEAALIEMDEDWKAEPVDFALKTLESWYIGDGHYSDGPEFHWDYYNSLVMHPWMLDILEIMKDKGEWYNEFYQKHLKYAQRYVEIQERFIAPDGTYPPIGRSLAYRFGHFHALAHLSNKKLLPKSLSPAQVRCGLTAVIERVMQAPGNFDKNGWLQIGFYGHQPKIGESYINTGSLYACSLIFLPLGLSAKDEFWAAPDEDWTAKKIWSGVDMTTDKYLKLK